MRCVLIYNPASGRKRHGRVEQLRQVVDALTALGHQVELTYTTGPGSASSQARDAVRDGAGVVFACGGDGTIHEVLQGLVSETGEHVAALGVIPFGSANALARHMRLPLDPLKAALKQIHSAPQTVPIGRIEYGGEVRYFIVMAGAGPDGALVYKFLAGRKSAIGRMAYYFRAAMLFATRRFGAFEVEYTEAATGATFTRRAVSVMAIRVDNLGGLFSKLAVRAGRIEDTHLNLLVLSPPALFSLPLWFISGWFGLHGFNRFLGSVNVTGFTCFPLSDNCAHFQADGEWLGRIPMRVTLAESALRILIPHN